MQVQDTGPVAKFAQQFSDYLPQLTAGLFIAALGLVVGWLVKRALIRLLVWFRLDRLAGRVGWRAAMGKGDVRAALYNLVGTVAMVVVALVFVDNALEILGLRVLSRLIGQLVFYVPNLVLVGLIVGVGLLIANLVSERAEDALEEEEFEHARLIAKLLKGVMADGRRIAGVAARSGASWSWRRF